MMEMTGERIIAAPRATVWEALNDPAVLKATIPGCQGLEKTSDTSFEATVVQKIGPVKATFNGAVELTDIVPGESYRIEGEGKGGVAGMAKGGADVRLADVDGGTKLSYAASAKVSGKIAQIGSRLIDNVANKLADEFFTRFKEEIEGASASGSQPEITEAGSDEATIKAAQATAAPGAAGISATQTGATNIAQTTSGEPGNQQWYLWIILAIIAALLLWWLL